MSKTIATPEQKVGQNKSITLDNTTTVEDIRAELSDIEEVDSVNYKQHADNLLFNEEIVEVMVFPSSDKNAEKIVDVYNNGTPQRFIRGRWQEVKRKYVEILARAKPFSVSTPEVPDGENGRTTKIETTTGLRYPFEMRDKNPRGAAWLQGILAEA